MNLKHTLKAVVGGLTLAGACMHAFAEGAPYHVVNGNAGSAYSVVGQQQLTVRGQVTSADDPTGLTGVSVSIKGASRGVGTDEEGRYVLENVPSNATLVFTMVGFSTHEEQVNGRNSINVVMEATMSDLDEVVVVGYGVQKRVTKTGAVAQVSGEELKRAPVVNVENALVGRVPGLMAINAGGEPGYDGSRIMIRGRNTLNAGNAGPLIVIDGIPDRGGMGRLDANDIESISVLKDASAAIYGARSANGVILITTKRGVTGEPRIPIAIIRALSHRQNCPRWPMQPCIHNCKMKSWNMGALRIGGHPRISRSLGMVATLGVTRALTG